MIKLDLDFLLFIIIFLCSGDVAKFRALKPQWTKQTDLARNEPILFQKVREPVKNVLAEFVR